ncbi:MAG: alpha/beta hydrolase [Gemmataceae bacterium]|nr:alpha/beta hydrolase [Gemmataceae bacterium]
MLRLAKFSLIMALLVLRFYADRAAAQPASSPTTSPAPKSLPPVPAALAGILGPSNPATITVRSSPPLPAAPQEATTATGSVVLKPASRSPAAAPQQAEPLAAPSKTVGRGVVFVLDGSGRIRLMTDDLQAAVAHAGLSLEVREFDWSHGVGRVFADLRNRWHHDAQGAQLAATLVAERKDDPQARLYVVAHSAGAAVVLAAVDRLPPKTLQRIILLAPAVSAGVDLRPALKATRQGVDVFYSSFDLIARGLSLTGTTDGSTAASAGATGFSSPTDDSSAALRQYPYTSEMAATGHRGGHYGWTKYGFLRDYVVPLLDGAR